MHTFNQILLASTALLPLTFADQGRRGDNEISTVFTTVTLPGFSVGIDGTVPAATVTGTATIDEGVTIINDGESLYMIGTAGEQVRNGLSAGTAIWMADNDGSSVLSSGAAKTGSSATGSSAGTTPTGGAMEAMATTKVLALLGLGAMVALVA
ncbi:hypothetical protein C8R45DRAFT_1090696 [Mycena sanguinolenta]|nr:hypothetical protein C8R45DRAFT_1090696 [Mycena sanguinolenta]